MAEDFKPLLKPFTDETSANPPAAAASQPRVLSPVPGFWGRAAAFLVDAGLLTFICYMTANYAYKELYPLRWVCQPAAALLVFVYFWIGSGPLTKGQTVGKFVLGYRTIALDRDGPPSAGQAALRAAMTQAIVLTYVVVLVYSIILVYTFAGILFLPFRDPLHGPSPSHGFFVAVTILYCLATAYAMGNAVFCGLHPKKLSIHDLLTHTAVVRGAEEARALEFHKEWDENDRVKLKLAIYPSVCLGLVVLVFFGNSFISSHSQRVESLKTLDAIRERLEVPGFHLQAVVGPSLKDQKFFDESLKKGEALLEDMNASEKNGAAEGLTTRTAYTAQQQAHLERRVEEFRKYGRDGRKFIFDFDCDDSRSTRSLTADPHYRELLARLPAAAESLAASLFTDEEGKPLPYRAIQVEFREILPLYLHVEIRSVYRELIPLDDPSESAP